jgi:YidC/Oxa1 family membrane protein insertase
LNTPFLSLAILLQFVNPLVPPLQALLQWLNDTVKPYNPIPEQLGSFAIALILIAIIVKVVTYPLSLAQTRSMRSMQQLQPKLAELNQKHKGDREKLAQAQMELYREHGVNPFGGCLPLVITMVVLFSLYAAIDGLKVQMQNQPFFWIQDIALCEPSPFCDQANAMAIPFLVVVMILSQLLYQKYLTPPTTDPQAQSMNAVMKFMPLMFGFIFIRLPAGLVLYYLVFNFVSIAQQLYMNRKLGMTTMVLPVPGSSDQDPVPAPPPQEELASHERGDVRRRRRKKGA